MSLKQWADNGWLKPHKTSRQEIGSLLAIARKLTFGSGSQAGGHAGVAGTSCACQPALSEPAQLRAVPGFFNSLSFVFSAGLLARASSIPEA